MLRTSLFAALALVVLAPAVLAAPTADPAESERVLERFKEAARRSIGPRSGDLFALPNKYNYIIDMDYMAPEQSEIERNGQVSTISHRGNHHGTVWDYDVRIPIALYGPGYVERGMVLQVPATQQDIVPTLAHVLGVVPPEDANGRVLHEALKAANKPPKAVLVVVFDQGGSTLYEHHPKAAPFVTGKWAEGARYVNAMVTHIDPETVVGHTAIGTGAYPRETGVVANKPWVRHAGQAAMTIAGTSGATPVFIESPSLADVWLQATKNQAIVISQSLADRAAIGMVGHGSWYGQNKKPIVNFFNEKQGAWTTNETFYTQPDYVKAIRPEPFWKAAAGQDGLWRGHRIDDFASFKQSPAGAAFDGAAMRAMIEREPVGVDEVPDLVFWSMKSTDYSGHRFGQETLETRDTLTRQDQEVKAVVEALEKRVGKDRLLVVFTADHGGAPLAELHGGSRIAEHELVSTMNQHFDKKANGVDLVQHVTSTQLYLNDAEMAANGVTLSDVQGYLKRVHVNGKPFFLEVFTREEIARP